MNSPLTNPLFNTSAASRLSPSDLLLDNDPIPSDTFTFQPQPGNIGFGSPIREHRSAQRPYSPPRTTALHDPASQYTSSLSPRSWPHADPPPPPPLSPSPPSTSMINYIPYFDSALPLYWPQYADARGFQRDPTMPAHVVRVDPQWTSSNYKLYPKQELLQPIKQQPLTRGPAYKFNTWIQFRWRDLTTAYPLILNHPVIHAKVLWECLSEDLRQTITNRITGVHRLNLWARNHYVNRVLESVGATDWLWHNLENIFPRAREAEINNADRFFREASLRADGNNASSIIARIDANRELILELVTARELIKRTCDIFKTHPILREQIPYRIRITPEGTQVKTLWHEEDPAAPEPTPEWLQQHPEDRNGFQQKLDNFFKHAATVAEQFDKLYPNGTDSAGTPLSSTFDKRQQRSNQPSQSQSTHPSRSAQQNQQQNSKLGQNKRPQPGGGSASAGEPYTKRQRLQMPSADQVATLSDGRKFDKINRLFMTPPSDSQIQAAQPDQCLACLRRDHKWVECTSRRTHFPNWKPSRDLRTSHTNTRPQANTHQQPPIAPLSLQTGTSMAVTPSDVLGNRQQHTQQNNRHTYGSRHAHMQTSQTNAMGRSHERGRPNHGHRHQQLRVPTAT